MGANAQTSVPKFSAGEVLTAANQNISAGTGVPVFVSTAARDAAFGGTGEKDLADGQFCYLEVTPKRFQVYNGTGWQDWFVDSDAFTPTWTNLTVGNGTVTARYIALGRFTYASIKFVFGSTSSITGTVSVSLPVAASATFTNQYIGQVRMLDASFGFFSGTIQQLSGTAGEILVTRSDGVYASDSLINATIPMTWVTTDTMYINMFYQRP
jgi:hypothetical protein